MFSKWSVDHAPTVAVPEKTLLRATKIAEVKLSHCERVAPIRRAATGRAPKTPERLPGGSMHGNSHAISASDSYGCPEAASSQGQPEDRTHDLACEALWNQCVDAVADGLLMVSMPSSSARAHETAEVGDRREEP